MYRKKDGRNLLIVAIYVDDLFVTGNSVKEIKDFKKDMSKNFEMFDLGLLTYYLGLEVRQSSNCIMINQEAYARRILKEAAMDECNSMCIPIEFGLQLAKGSDESEIDATFYRRRIGFKYLMHTRPDMAFSVSILSRYMHSPRASRQCTETSVEVFERNGQVWIVIQARRIYEAR